MLGKITEYNLSMILLDNMIFIEDVCFNVVEADE